MEVQEAAQTEDLVQEELKEEDQHQVMKVDIVPQKEMQDQLTNQKTLLVQVEDTLIQVNQCQVVEVVMVVQ